MVQLQSIDRSINQRSRKQAKLSMPPQWGQTFYQVAFLFKIILSIMKVLCKNIWNDNKVSLFIQLYWSWIKGPIGVCQGSIMGPTGSVIGGLIVTKFGELIWTALQIETWSHYPIYFRDCFFGLMYVCQKKDSRVYWVSVGCLWGLFW